MAGAAEQALVRRELLSLRDRSLALLKELVGPLEPSVAALEVLETWYLARAKTGFRGAGATRREVESALGIFLGAVAVAEHGYHWTVAANGGSAELGVERADRLHAVMGLEQALVGWRPPKRGELLREYRRLWPLPEKRRPATLPFADAEQLRTTIVDILSAKSTTLVYPADLPVLVEHRLRKTNRVSRRDVNRVIRELETAGVLVRVESPRTAKFRYQLRDAAARPRAARGAAR
ncbi:MAG: hypothetical protein U0271_46440 [Polyangiaceae bacterium]